MEIPLWRPENQKENQAGLSSERVVEGQRANRRGPTQIRHGAIPQYTAAWLNDKPRAFFCMQKARIKQRGERVGGPHGGPARGVAYLFGDFRFIQA